MLGSKTFLRHFRSLNLDTNSKAATLKVGTWPRLINHTMSSQKFSNSAQKMQRNRQLWREGLKRSVSLLPIRRLSVPGQETTLIQPKQGLAQNSLLQMGICWQEARESWLLHLRVFKEVAQSPPQPEAAWVHSPFFKENALTTYLLLLIPSFF